MNLSEQAETVSAPRFSTPKVIVFSLLPALVLLAGLEVAARVYEQYVPPRVVDYGLGFLEESRVFVPDPNDPSFRITDPRKQDYFVTQRFAAQKAPGTLRIVFLGESSVNFLNHLLAPWAERLTHALQPVVQRVEFINCGGKSYGSHRLMLVAREMLDYAPDVLLIYMGHNEFEEVEQLKLADLKTARLQAWLAHSALFRFMRDRYAEKYIADLQAAAERRKQAGRLPDQHRAWMYDWREEDVAQRMKTFQENMEYILSLYRSAGIPVLLGTVPSNLMKPHLTGAYGERYEREVLPLFREGRYEEGYAKAQEILRNAPRHQASAAENEILRGLAQKFDVPLVDVEAAVRAAEPHGIPGERLFGDHCHLNAEGNAVLVREYETALLSLLKSQLGIN